MATTHTVVRGDTLWGIAEKYLGDGTKYTQLAAINDIPNPDLISVGQVIKLSGSSSSSGSSSDAKQVTINQFGLQSDIDNVLFVTWSWSRSNTEEYEVRWDYYTSNKIWFGGSSSTSTTKDKFATYNIPSNARQIRVKIRPISKTYKNGDKDVEYWYAEWCGWQYHTVEVKPDTPTGLNVTLEGLELKAELSNLKGEPSIVQFEVTKDDATTIKLDKVDVKTGSASYSCTVTAGSFYKVRCRACKNDVYSEWSEYSDNLESAPAVPAGFTKCEPGEPSLDGPTIVLSWASISTAVKYDIEYTTVKSYFDTTNQTTTISGVETTTWQIVSGVEDGKEYFFRIRSVNSRNETSGWSEISSTVIGKAPAPPTTWSSTTTVIVGEPLYFYWIHNSEDGSKLTYSYIRVLSNEDGNWTEVLGWDIDHTKEDEETTTGSYEFDTSSYAEGTQLQWAVKTAGVSKTYSEYSIQRTVDIYAQPTLELRLTNNAGSAFETLDSFPFNISAVPGPATQAPVWYHLEITANEFYETVDNVGNVKMVNAGEQVYSKHFDISTSLETVISAGDVHLENNVSYTVTCTVSMNSGLTATASSEFVVSWVDSVYKPDVEIGIDEDTLSAYIRPFCETRSLVFYKVDLVSNAYRVDTTTKYESVSRVYTRVPYTDTDGTTKYRSVVSEPLGRTVTGEEVYSGVTAEGESVMYCEVEAVVPVEDVTLAVYRREFDGSFTELASGLDGAKNTFITDPHPSLDYARYRIVATSKTTSSVSYYDPPGYPVGGKSVVIQWNEAWSQFDTFGNEDALEQPPWSGSMLKLPYNIDVSNKHSADVALVEYIGRKRPVSYYGTQLGETATWNVVIEKSDIDTLYALRRLAVWMGDVYVREPSGSGYWANVKVSFSQKHRDLTIPVTIEVTRVEGGA